MSRPAAQTLRYDHPKTCVQENMEQKQRKDFVNGFADAYQRMNSAYQKMDAELSARIDNFKKLHTNESFWGNKIGELNKENQLLIELMNETHPRLMEAGKELRKMRLSDVIDNAFSKRLGPRQQKCVPERNVTLFT
jgi:hypothetical protein